MTASRHNSSCATYPKIPRVRRCAICGSTKEIEEHHLGGRKHAGFFTIPLCRHHHQAVTIGIARAGVNMQYTSNIAERAKRARMAAYVFLWYLDEATDLNDNSGLD
jgi:hypothetical protein